MGASVKDFLFNAAIALSSSAITVCRFSSMLGPSSSSHCLPIAAGSNGQASCLSASVGFSLLIFLPSPATILAAGDNNTYGIGGFNGKSTESVRVGVK
jgi:hypothetical protein